MARSRKPKSHVRVPVSLLVPFVLSEKGGRGMTSQYQELTRFQHQELTRFLTRFLTVS